MTHQDPRARPWRDAWDEALYGPTGFYRRPEGPAGHFRTAAHASPRGMLGAALARLARRTGCSAVLDVGAGRGELLTAVHAADPDLICTGVDVVPRPGGLPPAARWATQVPVPHEPTLLVAWELLDVVPAPVLEVDGAGRLRVVEVCSDGSERLGAPAGEDDVAWCRRWWPGARPGARVEVGRTRDNAWAHLVDLLAPAGGVALAVDYGHDRGSRPASGTLVGYRGGRVVEPVPDGSCDLTAHVALDSVTAVRAAGVRLRQRDALRALGLPPPRAEHRQATTDPVGYLAALAAAGEAAELLDAGGLGGFAWVLHAAGEPAAAALRSWSAEARPDPVR